jgi:hypothetical protein
VRWATRASVHIDRAACASLRFDAPEAPGLDVVLRGRSMVVADDHQVLELTGPIFDGLYEYHRRALLLGRPPA